MRLELLKPHTHAGLALQPGTVIALDDDQVRWLVDIGVARIPTALQAPKPKHLPHNEEKSL